MTNRHIKRALRNIRYAREIQDYSWLLDTVLRKKRRAKVNVAGVPLSIRTATPDLHVAKTSLVGEFDQAFALLPELTNGFIVDAGGYIGTAAIAFSRRYPDAKVVTIEPNASNYAVLLENVAAWKNIIPINAAVASAAGEMTLYDRGEGEWGFTLVRDSQDRSSRSIGTVPCITIADVMSRYGFHGVDLVKIDIEGGEKDLLQGAVDWMRSARLVCAELHDRIAPGCSAAWDAATIGRKNSKMDGEKYLSLAS